MTTEAYNLARTRGETLDKISNHNSASTQTPTDAMRQALLTKMESCVDGFREVVAQLPAAGFSDNAINSAQHARADLFIAYLKIFNEVEKGSKNNGGW